MREIFTRLVNDQSGVTAIEYGMIAALIAVAIIGAVSALGGQLSTLFGTISTSI
jgi:pilus assembly protein Flp/PilA